jgi:hypothetical protein
MWHQKLFWLKKLFLNEKWRAEPAVLPLPITTLIQNGAHYPIHKYTYEFKGIGLKIINFKVYNILHDLQFDTKLKD